MWSPEAAQLRSQVWFQELHTGDKCHLCWASSRGRMADSGVEAMQVGSPSLAPGPGAGEKNLVTAALR